MTHSAGSLDTIFNREPKGAIIPVKMDGTYSDPHPGGALGADTKNTRDKGKSSDPNKP